MSGAFSLIRSLLIIPLYGADLFRGGRALSPVGVTCSAMIYKVTLVSTWTPDLTSPPTNHLSVPGGRRINHPRMRKVPWPASNRRCLHTALETLWDIEDPYVRCVQGGAQQLIEQADEPLNGLHTPACLLRSDLPPHPWKALKALLENRQQEQASPPAEA